MESSEHTVQSKRTNLDWFVPLYAVVIAAILVALPVFLDEANLEKIHYSQNLAYVGAAILVVASLLFVLVKPIDPKRQKD